MPKNSAIKEISDNAFPYQYPLKSENNFMGIHNVIVTYGWLFVIIY